MPMQFIHLRVRQELEGLRIARHQVDYALG
jgi:hypothetical protein